MGFEENQDLRILSLIADHKGKLSYDAFKELTKNEDSNYIHSMISDKKYIQMAETWEADKVSGNRIHTGVWEYWITTLGRNRLDSLIELKSKGNAKEWREKWNFRLTLIAAVAAVLGIIVSVLLHYL